LSAPVPALHQRIAGPALALGAGTLVALALPPWGFWPLAFVGVALFEIALGETPTTQRRAGYGFLFGAGWMYLGMAWMVQLTAPGYVIAGAVFAGYHLLAELVTPVGRWSTLGRPAAHSLAEALRFSFPFGGVPLATIGMTQVGGPVVGVVRVAGVIALTWLVFQVSISVVVIARHVRRDADRPWVAIGGGVAALALVAVSAIAPRGSATGDTLRVAAVQGGGEQGTSALDVPTRIVTERHLEATRSIDAADDVELVLWPENTIDVAVFAGSEIHDLIAVEAGRLGVPIAVGVTEDPRINSQIVVGPDGEIVDQYVKVRRVPFGEYVPLRALLEFLGAPVGQVGRDAEPGTGPAVLDLPDGRRLATVISWEVFFAGRAREGVKLGGSAIFNPTNGASYTGTIVQTQQVASSRLRAIENGRFVVQAAPTGFSAIVDADGSVRQRTAVGERNVLFDTIELRSGRTWYTNLGDGPVIAALLAVLLASILLTRVRGPRAVREQVVGVAGSSDADREAARR
jgi:apolipoprotein N-acyltransferase